MTPTIERYNDSDRNQFIDLHREVFETNLTGELFDWQYNQHPKADTPQIVVAKDGDELVGAVGTRYIPFRVSGRVIWGSNPQDIMIREEYRSGGLFVKLVGGLRELYNDVDVEFGVPTEETRIVWKRFADWEYSHVDRHVRIHRPEDLLDLDDRSLLAVAFRLCGGVFRIGLQLLDMYITNGTYDGSVTREEGYVPSRFDIEVDESDYSVSLPPNHGFWFWRTADPRLESYTYSVSESGSQIASVLVSVTGKNISECVISLQKSRSSEKGYAALVSIYNRIVEDHRNCTAVTVTNNNITDMCKAAGINHNQLINRLGYNNIPNYLLDRMPDIPSESELKGKVMGYNWLDDECNVKPTDWEFSDLLLDYGRK